MGEWRRKSENGGHGRGARTADTQADITADIGAVTTAVIEAG